MILPLVMRGLDPRINDEAPFALRFRMDCRVKPGNDEVFAACEIAR
jgi:hypothetical protein